MNNPHQGLAHVSVAVVNSYLSHSPRVFEQLFGNQTPLWTAAKCCIEFICHWLSVMWHSSHRKHERTSGFVACYYGIMWYFFIINHRGLNNCWYHYIDLYFWLLSWHGESPYQRKIVLNICARATSLTVRRQHHSFSTHGRMFLWQYRRFF